MTASACDKCTLFSDQNLINVRNEKADAHHAYAPNKQMFLLGLKAGIVACAMKILGLDKIDLSPAKYFYPKAKSRLAKGFKRVHIKNVASQILFWMKNLTTMLLNMSSMIIVKNK